LRDLCEAEPSVFTFESAQHAGGARDHLDALPRLVVP
jgi:hypothetical protein